VAMEPSNRWSTSSGSPPKSPRKRLRLVPIKTPASKSRERHKCDTWPRARCCARSSCQIRYRIEPQGGDARQFCAFRHRRQELRDLAHDVVVGRLHLHHVESPAVHRHVADAQFAATSTNVLDTSLSTLAPAATAARATDSFACPPRPTVGAQRGDHRTTRAISSSTATGVAPGRVDSPPRQRLSQPASRALPRSTASTVRRCVSRERTSPASRSRAHDAGLSAMQSDVGG